MISHHVYLRNQVEDTDSAFIYIFLGGQPPQQCCEELLALARILWVSERGFIQDNNNFSATEMRKIKRISLMQE